MAHCASAFKDTEGIIQMSENTQEAGTPNNNKPVEAFYTGKNDAGPKVSISINPNTKTGAPKFIGMVGEKKVGGYIRKGPTGAFIAFVGDRDKQGQYPQLGAGNIVVNRNANVRLSLKMKDCEESIWVNVADGVDQDLLVECGLNLDILASKREAAKAGSPAGN
jgi:hypothetical protein